MGSCNIEIAIESGSSADTFAVSLTVQDTVAPSMPANFAMVLPAASPSSENSPSFSAELSDASGSLSLYAGANCVGLIESFSVDSLSESFSVSAALSDGDYQFSVRHTDAHSNESACSATSIPLRVDTLAPNPPTNLVTSQYVNSLTGSPLSYDASSSDDVAHYLVKIEDDTAATVLDWTQVGGLSFQSLNNLSLVECSRTYKFRVKAVDGAGQESGEAVLADFTYDATPPALVTSLANLDNGALNLSEELTFTGASDSCSQVDYYEMAVSLTEDESGIVTGWGWQAVAASPYRISSASSLAEGNQYYSLIRAVDRAGNTGAFEKSAAWQIPGPPASVGLVSVISRSIDALQLGWTEPNNNGRVISDYLVEYKESSSEVWLEYSDGISSDIVMTVGGPVADTSYDFRVTSFNGNYALAPSNVVTDSTLIDDPFFESTSYQLMNIGGATQTDVVAFEDETDIKLDGEVLVTLNAGETHGFSSALYQVLEANKPIYASGKVTGVSGNNTDGNVVWVGKDWAGERFVFTLTRSAPHFLGIYSFEDDNVITIYTPNAANNINLTLAKGAYDDFSLTDSGGFRIESSGPIIAYTYSHENQNRVVDPKPILPASNELIGFPSMSVKFTTNSASATVNYFHGDDNSGNMSVNLGQAQSINGRAKFSGEASQYRAQPLKLRSTEPIVANSNADSDGYCSAPFVPTVLMRKRFAVNVLAQYVAFASIYDAVINVYYPDGSTSSVALTRTGSDAESPYSAYFTNIPAGTRFESDKRMQGWYEPDTDDYGSKDDETIMIGYD